MKHGHIDQLVSSCGVLMKLFNTKKLFIKQVGIVYVSAFGPDLQNKHCIF